MISKRKTYTEPLTRAWLENRIQAFVPRIKKAKKTKAAPYEHTLDFLVLDLERTLTELKDRVGKRNGVSECCGEAVRVAHGCDSDFGHRTQVCTCNEGVTCWFECTKCGKTTTPR